MIKAESYWLAPNMKQFTVEYTEEKNGDVWVHYHDSQGQKFSCLKAAFLDKFKQDISY